MGVLIFITQAQLLPSVYRLPINECSHSENQFDQNERRLDAIQAQPPSLIRTE